MIPMYNCGYRTRAPDTRVFIETCATFHQFPYGTLYDGHPSNTMINYELKNLGRCLAENKLSLNVWGGGGLYRIPYY